MSNTTHLHRVRTWRQVTKMLFKSSRTRALPLNPQNVQQYQSVRETYGVPLGASHTTECCDMLSSPSYSRHARRVFPKTCEIENFQPKKLQKSPTMTTLLQSHSRRCHDHSCSDLNGVGKSEAHAGEFGKSLWLRTSVD